MQKTNIILRGLGAIIIAILLILLTALCVQGVRVGMLRDETVRCNQLEKQSKEFKDAGFYITKIEDEMCRSHGIEINSKIQ